MATGSEDLARLGARLKEAGARDLRLMLLRKLRESGAELIPEIEKSARETLPKRGGLAAEVAQQKVSLRTSFAASGARVRLQAARSMKELRDIDSGHVRHPTFAHTRSLFSGNTRGAGLVIGRRSGEWHSQEVTPGYFSKPVEEGAPLVRRNIRQAMDDIARKITEGI